MAMDIGQFLKYKFGLAYFLNLELCVNYKWESEGCRVHKYDP